MRNAICAVITAVLMSATMCASNAAETTKLWLSPDGRYAAVFPGTPQEVDITMQGGGGKGYALTQATTEGPVQYLVSVVRTPGLPDRIITSDVRKILEMSAGTLVDTLGGDRMGLKLNWSTFPGMGPKLAQEFTYSLKGVLIRSQGFAVMDGTRHVRVAVSLPSSNSTSRRADIDAFLQSFMVITSTTERDPVLAHIRRVTSAAGLQEFKCPDQLVNEMREGLERSGGALLGAGCYFSENTMDHVKARVEAAQIAEDPKEHRGPWKSSGSGGFRRVEKIASGGVGWWVSPPESFPPAQRPAKARTVVVTQAMK